jgi:PhnB protein
MKLNLHISLAFDGQCEAAFRFYERCLNGTITFMLTWGSSPAAREAPPGWEAKIYHATLRVGDAVITGGDVAPERYEQPKGFSVVLEMDDRSQAERIFDALAEHATIQMPLQETFWAARFAMLVDRFGTPWMINCEKAA